MKSEPSCDGTVARTLAGLKSGHGMHYNYAIAPHDYLCRDGKNIASYLWEIGVLSLIR